MSSVWTRANEHNVTKTPAVEGGEYAEQGANPGHADGAAFVRQLIGDGAKVETTGRSIEYWTGDSMSDTGLAYNISGRATVIEAGVGERLAGFQDPIKAIFGTSICHDKTVIVKRKYVVGGAATITPERAPARTVQVREDVQSVELQRYGGDVTMNTNLFLSPSDASAEMNMKLDAQKKQLENKLVELGYNEIFDKALRLPDVAVRANPTFSSNGDVDVDSPEARAYARTVYFRSCFGAFAKHEFPLANLLASCKTSGAYTAADGDATVLVIPHGSSEMLRYTKSSSMNYSITGLRTEDQKPVTMAIENVAEDPSSGVKIMVHVPPSSYARGAALPSTDKGMLSEDVSIFMVYSTDFSTGRTDVIPDLQNGGWKSPNINAGTFTTSTGSSSSFRTTTAAFDKYEQVVREYETTNTLSGADRATLNDYFARNLRKVADTLGNDANALALIDSVLQGTAAINISPTASGLSQGLTAGTSLESSTRSKLNENSKSLDFGSCGSVGEILSCVGRQIISGLSEAEARQFIANACKFIGNSDGPAAESPNSDAVTEIYSAISNGRNVNLHHVKAFNVVATCVALASKNGNKTHFAEPIMKDLMQLWKTAEAFIEGVAEPTKSSSIKSSDSPSSALLKLASQYAGVITGTKESNTSKNSMAGHLFKFLDLEPGTRTYDSDSLSSYFNSNNFSQGVEYLKKWCGISADAVAIAESADSKQKFSEAMATALSETNNNADLAKSLATQTWMKWFCSSAGLPMFIGSGLGLIAFEEAAIRQGDLDAFSDAAEQITGYASSAFSKLCSAAESCKEFIANLPTSIKLAGGTTVAVGLAAAVAEHFYPGLVTGILSQFAPSAPIGRDIDYKTLLSRVGLTFKAPGDSTDRQILVRELKVKMSSAIIAKSGADTGELLVGYPMTGVSTNQRTESMTVALRVYLGAILKKPENVTIIPHVAFEGIVKHDDWFYAVAQGQSGQSPAESGGIGFVEIPSSSSSSTPRQGYAYPGTWAKFTGGKYEIQQENTGPLGHLDDPYYMECVNGLQVYKAAPMQTVTYNKFSRA